MATVVQAAESSPQPEPSNRRRRIEAATVIAVATAILAFLTYNLNRHQDQATASTQFLTVFSSTTKDLNSNSSDSTADVYVLQNLMQSFPGEQPLVVKELVYYIRAHATSSSLSASGVLNPEVQSALTVLITRNIGNDGNSVINLNGLFLNNGNFAHGQLAGMNLAGTVFKYADFDTANLAGADLQGSDLGGANLVGANLSGANLSHTNLGSSLLDGANLKGADLTYANLGNAEISGTTQHLSNACTGTQPSFPSFGYLCKKPKS